MNKYIEWITVSEDDYLGLMRERNEARRIARALYPLLAGLRALEELDFFFGDDGTSVAETLNAWDALLIETDKAREAIRRESSGGANEAND